MSYWGLGRNIPEVQDHVNLYWSVSWIWDSNEVLSQLANAKARGMPAIVHTEFAFFSGTGQYANSCPYTLRNDASARWSSFVQSLSDQGLLDTVAAFYPMDEPDVCGVSPTNVQNVLNIIRAHPLTSTKRVAVVFGCDIAKQYGDPTEDDHAYGNVLRSYDWVGVDCYGNNIFTDTAWDYFDLRCFCRRYGPVIYDNFKLQLQPTQRVILVPQGFIAADDAPDDPYLFASHANSDPSVIAMVPFTWFDQVFYPGVRSQPTLAAQWWSIGRQISLSNPPTANPPLPTAVEPRLQANATDVQHFSVSDVSCNFTTNDPCEVQLFWQLANNVSTQMFVHHGASTPQLVSCQTGTAVADIPWMSGAGLVFEVYQLSGGCPTTVPAGAKPIASVTLSLVTPARPNVVATASRKVHANAGTFDLPLSPNALDPSTEPRNAGVGNSHSIVFTFDKTVSSGTATITEGTATAGTPTFNGNEMTVPITGVANAQYVTIAVSNVVSSDGTSGGSGSVRIGFLVGDVNGSRTVTLSDMLVVNAALTQTVTSSNFVRDVNVSGTLTLSDLLAINPYLTRMLPAP